MRSGKSDASPPTEAEVARILSRALPGHRLLSCEPLTGGRINTNLRLRVEGLAETFVLRFYTRIPSACQKEVDLHKLVADVVPVPEIVYANSQGEHNTAPHVLMRWMEGITLRELKSKAGDDEIGEAADAIGTTLARIGSFTLPRSGWIGEGLAVGDPLIEGTDPIPRFVEKCLESSEMSRRLDASVRDRLRAFIWAWAPQLATLDAARSLVHSDFNAPNILLKRAGGKWIVAAVLDWEFAISGSPLFDVGNFLRYERRSRPLLEPHFSRGFRDAGGALPEGWRETARASDLAALSEILTRPDLPGPIACDVASLIVATIEDTDPPDVG